MKQISCVVLASLELFACKSAARQSQAEEFYKNTRRREAEISELEPLARLVSPDQSGFCSAFFVENKNKLPLVATAAHCFAKRGGAETWCEEKGLVRGGLTGKMSFCKKVHFNDKKFDLVLLEIEASVGGGVLKMGAFIPKRETHLKLVGYPGDKFNPEKKALVSENCQVLKEKTEVNYASVGRDTRGVTLSEYNCTVYGGNSGGPVLLEGTNVAIGMPFDFSADNYDEQDGTYPDESTHAVLFSNLLGSSDKRLEEIGVSVVREQPEMGHSDDYLGTGFCSSESEKDSKIHISPEYRNGTVVKELKVKYFNSGKDPIWEAYPTCEKNICTAPSGNKVQLFGTNRVVTTWTGQKPHGYVCAGMVLSQ